MFVTLLGRPGSGKTSLGKELAGALDLPYLGGGEMLRALVSSRGDGWEQAEACLRTRTDSPPDVQLKLLQGALVPHPTGAILDGFPKRAELHPVVEGTLGTPIALAAYLDTPAEVASYRIAHRLVCDQCGRPVSDLDHAEDETCPASICPGRLKRRQHEQDVSHEREVTDSVALRDIFGRLDRLLVVSAATTVSQRVELVLRECERRAKDFPTKSGDGTALEP
jgi:adenylate kinase family enzyme